MPTLDIDVRARFAELLDGMDKVRKEAGRTGQEIEKAFGVLKTIAGYTVGGLGIGAIGMAFRSTVTDLTAFMDGAERAGESVEKLSSLFYDLRPAKVPMEEILDLTGTMAEAMADIGDENSRASRAFKALGIDVRDSAGNLKSVIDVVREVSKEMEKYEDGTNKIVLAQSLLGESGAKFLPVFKRLGGIMEESAGATTESAKAARDFDEAIQNLLAGLGKARIAIFSNLLGPLNDLIGTFNDATEAGNGFLASLDIVQGEWNNKIRRMFGYGDNPNRSEFLKKDIKELEDLIADFKKDGPGLFETDKTLDTYQEKLRRLTEELEKVEKAEQKTLLRRQKATEPIADRPVAPLVLADPEEEEKKKKSGSKSEKISEGERLIEQLTRQLQGQKELTKLEEISLEINRMLAKDKKSITEADQDRLKLMAAQFDAAKKLQEQKKTEEELQKIINDADQRSNEQMRERIKHFEELANPVEKYLAQLREITKLEMDGGMSVESANKARDAVSAQIDALKDTKDKTKEAKTAAEELGLSFTSAAEDALVQWKGFGDFLQSLAADIKRMFIRKTLTEPFLNMLNEAMNAWGGPTDLGNGQKVYRQGASSNSTNTTLRAIEAANGIEYGPSKKSTGTTVNLYGSGVAMTDVTRAVRAGSAETTSRIMDQGRRGGGYG